MFHHWAMWMLQGGVEGGRVWFSQGLSGGDPLPVQEKKVCANPCPVQPSLSPVLTCLIACVAGWFRAMVK